MSKWFELNVVRKSYTSIYVEAPDGVTPAMLMLAKNSREIGRIADETTDRHDWDDFGWEEDVEVTSVKEVTEEKAKEFEVGQIGLT
jgi:hypothetical protein